MWERPKPPYQTCFNLADVFGNVSNPWVTQSKTRHITIQKAILHPSHTSSSTAPILKLVKPLPDLSKSGHWRIVARVTVFLGMGSAVRTTEQHSASLAVSRVSLSWIEPRLTTKIKITVGFGPGMVVRRHRQTSRAALLQ